jgi:hypothetical protein
MAQDANVVFNTPQPIFRSTAQVEDERQTMINIKVSGPEEAVRRYLETAKIAVKLVPLTEVEPPSFPDEDQAAAVLLDTVLPNELVEINIEVVQTVLQEYALLLNVDPTLLPGNCGHAYYLFEVEAVQAGLIPGTFTNNPDLFLGERPVHRSRYNPRRPNATSPDPDNVQAHKVGSGDWQLLVFERNRQGCQYELSGIFYHQPELI